MSDNEDPNAAANVKYFSEDIVEKGTGMELESMCMNCGEAGTTRFLMIAIPYFREVLISAFECPHCFLKNNEIQPASSIEPQGVEITFQVKEESDLRRQIIRSEKCNVKIPELDLEIPSTGTKGDMTTIEGVLSKVQEGLESDQEKRRDLDPENALKIDLFLAKIKQCLLLDMEWTLIMEDVSGNSYVQNPHAPKKDPQMSVRHFARTPQQNFDLGIQPTVEQEKEAAKQRALEEAYKQANAQDPNLNELKTKVADVVKTMDDDDDPTKELLQFPCTCSSCGGEGQSRMCVTHIPFFKEIVIMAFICENCGYKDTEVKAGGAISKQGRKTTFRVTCKDDLDRDLLKSESCNVKLPELDLELYDGTLGGLFTTIEGLVTKVVEHLRKANPFAMGDSVESNAERKEFLDFLSGLEQMAKTDVADVDFKPFTLILDDPLQNSYIQNIYAPDPDPEMTIEDYDRTWDQDEDLGLHDMKTENYADDNKATKEEAQ
eukprot:GFYU01001716.1.p1 GENE.GFYU01001716.1~~GFYU01001716.1.p1  ORF type:complete len:490 (+),score=150.42 GFYU01001716.1:79-1548(+)